MSDNDEARKRVREWADSFDGAESLESADVRTVLHALDAAEEDAEKSRKAGEQILADALRLGRERDEALAVFEALVENSQRVAGGPVPWVEIEAEVWDRYLTGVPADVLRERDDEILKRAEDAAVEALTEWWTTDTSPDEDTSSVWQVQKAIRALRKEQSA